LGEFTLENVRFTDLKVTSVPMANADEPLTVRMKDVTVEFHNHATDNVAFTVGENSNTTLIVQ
jgi:hypothetical protein